VRVVVKVVAKAVVVEGVEEVAVVVVIVTVVTAAETVEATAVDHAVEIVSTDTAQPVKRTPQSLSSKYTHIN